MNPYNPAVGSRRPKTYSPVVQQLADLDKKLASNYEFQDAIELALADYEVDNFEDLEREDPNTADRLVSLGMKLLKTGKNESSTEAAQSIVSKVLDSARANG